MGVVKTHVQYNSLHTIGHELYEISDFEVRRNLKSIFEEDIPSLNTNAYWRGRRYNLLVDEFNKVIPDCMRLLELVGIDIPNSLYSIAENYARGDTDVQQREKTVLENLTIGEIPRGEESVLDFKFEAVDGVKTTVTKRFKTMLEALQRYETTYNKKEWSGDAEQSFTGMLRNTIENITGIFNNLQEQFSSLMQQTMDDMKGTENANTVGGVGGTASEVHVEYAALHTIGKELYEIAETEIKSVLKSVYEVDIPGLNTNVAWRGKRYNLLVTEFNNIIPQCSEAIKLIGKDIPGTIYGIANNYANFDQETQRANDLVIEDISLPEIALGDETALDFDSARVEEARNGIVRKFAQVMSGIDAYEQKYNTRNWEGSAEQAFTTMIRKTKEDLQTIFDTLSTQFSNLMQQTVEDMTGIESANTVGGAAAAGTVAAGAGAAAAAGAGTTKGPGANSSASQSTAQSKDDFLLRRAADEKAAKQRAAQEAAQSKDDFLLRRAADEKAAKERAAEQARQKRVEDDIRGEQEAAGKANQSTGAARTGGPGENSYGMSKEQQAGVAAGKKFNEFTDEVKNAKGNPYGNSAEQAGSKIGEVLGKKARDVKDNWQSGPGVNPGSNDQW